MVKHTWQETNLFDDQSMATYFAEKLNLLKKKTIIWTREKKKKDDEALKYIEDILSRLESLVGGGFEFAKTKGQVIKLEVDHLRILKDKEESWQLKSSAI